MGETAFAFSGVGVAYGAVKALDGVTADIKRGEITCLAGPNGAGKTTLLKVAAALIEGTGTTRLFGRPLRDWPRDELARRVAYLPQGGEAAWPLSAYEIAALGRLPHGGGLTRQTEADAAAIARALARADIAHLGARPIDKLSTGERVRALFARALATEADVLLADEPAAHLDPEHQIRLMELLREEADRGAAVLVTLHELALAARCDRVIVLAEGRIAADGPPAAALSDAVLARVFRVEVHRAEGAPVPWRRAQS